MDYNSSNLSIAEGYLTRNYYVESHNKSLGMVEMLLKNV